ncbi:hypothetical protein RB601_001407 [Gaeumannomyces tritici]
MSTPSLFAQCLRGSRGPLARASASRASPLTRTFRTFRTSSSSSNSSGSSSSGRIRPRASHGGKSRISTSTPARLLSTTSPRLHGHVTPPKPGEELWVTFIDKEGQEVKLAVSKGDNLLDIAQAHDLEMEVLDDAYYDKMPEPEDDENDMLDLAFGLTETSRLGCQVTMTKELDGLRVRLPSMTRNLQASDFK